MIYLDHGATSFPKPPQVLLAMNKAMHSCANPGRGAYPAAMAAAETVYDCRSLAAQLFDCQPEQVCFTANATHGLNIAIGTLVKPGDRVLVTGFEHNAVVRPLHAIGAKWIVAGRKLFDRQDTLHSWEYALSQGVDAAVFTHVSNVFGYILPVEEMAALCRRYSVPFVIDAAQSAGSLPVKLKSLGADFIAMPGHKGLLGPQGTGLLLCNGETKPLLYGGSGNQSIRRDMPDELPERLEAGTLNVPGIAGLAAGLRYLLDTGVQTIGRREHQRLQQCVRTLQQLPVTVFAGEDQAATVSFIPQDDCEEVAQRLSDHGIAVRAGLHCAPLAHESAGTLESGTLRISLGWNTTDRQVSSACRILKNICTNA